MNRMRLTEESMRFYHEVGLEAARLAILCGDSRGFSWSEVAHALLIIDGWIPRDQRVKPHRLDAIRQATATIRTRRPQPCASLN